MTDLGRCTHRTRWHDGDPPNMRARSTRCTAPAEWICGDGGDLCDTHARAWYDRWPTITPMRIPRDGLDGDWRCPAWAVDALQATVDHLRTRIATPALDDQPTLWEDAS